ncbi:MAG: hypothetical protein KBT02_04385 [Treponema sp.]|nr:hypothetical protein [Candidatus Treponema caballi]
MALLQVRNFPDDLYEKLAQMAKKDNRSITQETICILGRAVGAEEYGEENTFSPYLVKVEDTPMTKAQRNRQRRLQVLAEIEALNLHLPEGAQTPEEMIREDRDR